MNLAIDFAAAMTLIGSAMLLLLISHQIAIDLQSRKTTWLDIFADAGLVSLAVCEAVTGLAVLFGWGGA